MRLFTALELPEHVRAGLNAWWPSAYALFDDTHWRSVAPHLWHVTLAFYGEVHGREADDLAEALAQCAANTSRLSLTLHGCGVFPRPTRPKVFWVGVNEADERNSLGHLARCCRGAGHATVRKLSVRQARFQGHVTLARFRGNRPVWGDRVWEQLPKLPEMDWKSESFSLFQSILSPQGPQYRRLETFAISRQLKNDGAYEF